MRKPEYTTDGAWRIISVPNGLWRLQQYTPIKGQNAQKANKDRPALVHIDPWQDRSHAVGQTEARGLLNARQPKKAGVA